MGELYVSLMLRSLALGVGSIFIPIYLYTLEYSLTAIAGFYIIQSAVRLIPEVLNGHMISRFGPKHVLSLSYVMAVLSFLALYMIPVWSGFFFIAALLLAVEVSWFWGAYHVHASESESRTKGSRQVSIIIILKRTSAALGPLIGGLVGEAFGLQYSLLLAALFLLLAIYPLFKTQDTYARHTFKWRFTPMPYNTVAFFGSAFNANVGMLIWPLFMFLTLQAFDELGFITSATIILGSFMTYQVGRLGDKGKNKLLLRVGSVIAAGSHVLRVFANNFTSFLGVNLLSDVGTFFLAGPLTIIRHTKANNNDRLNYIINSQLRVVAGKLFVWTLVAVLSLWFSISATLQITFLIAAIAASTIPLIAKDGVSVVE